MGNAGRWTVGPFVLAALVLAAPASAQTTGEGPSEGDDRAIPTFYADVLPVLQDNCVECHQEKGLNSGGMVAPMALTTYEEAREWAPMIAFRVSEGSMPPWHVAPQHKGTFVGERYLEESDKRTLLAWARGGTPEGDPADAPPPVDLPKTGGEEWWIGEPDFALFFDKPYLVEDDLHDRYVSIEVEMTEEMMPEHRWVKASEARPGGPHVHHITGGIKGMAPGSRPTMYEDGYSSLFCAGPRTISFNMHYNKQPGPGTAVEDVSGGAMVFYEEGEVIRHVVEGESLIIRDILIPAGDPNYSATKEYVFEEDMHILRFNPHMHLRGKAAKYEITYPDGEHEVLLDIPDYDFSWQQGYWFKEPVLAPKGSRVKMTLWWDNSAENPDNPDPTVDVRWGQPTYEEMAQGYMQMTRVEPLEIVVGEPIPDEFLRKCQRDDEDPESDAE